MQLVSGRDNLESHQSIREYGGVNPPLRFARLLGNIPLAAGGVFPVEVGVCLSAWCGLGWDGNVAHKLCTLCKLDA